MKKKDEVITPEDSFDNTNEYTEDTAEVAEEGEGTKQKKKFRINTHIVLLAVVLIVVLAVFLKFKNWGVFVDQKDIFSDGLGEYSDTMDLFVPLIGENGEVLTPTVKEHPNVLVFGNNPFADNRDSKDSLANMIEELSGANIINCSISDSYMACENVSLTDTDSPYDAFTPYWLMMMVTFPNTENYIKAAEVKLGNACPKETAQVRETLNNLDFNTIDFMCIMYDASDYLLSHKMYSDTDPSDITTFTGNMEATIEWVQEHYPHIRIIVMSPPYAFSDELDEKGNYISSDIKRYDWDVLSTYVIKQGDSCSARQVTFVDNLYGTITEENAKKYLSDNLHLNKAGRRKVAERFVYAMNYYNED